MAKKTSADRIVNVGAGIAAFVLLGYLGISYTYFNDEPVGCITSYPQALRFGLQSGEGLPLSMIELQAQAGGEEVGLMQNASIVNVEGAPHSRVMQVRVGQADATDPDSAVGIHFPWRPHANQQTTAGCLRYSVFLPADFDFSTGGILPGMFGGPTPERTKLASEQGFALRTRWGSGGDTRILALAKPIADGGRLPLMHPGTMRLERGRWVTIEQELVLNAPGASNGKVRMWVDGKMVFDKPGLKFREDDTIGIDGVVATIGMDEGPRDTPAKEQFVQITPIDFGWR